MRQHWLKGTVGAVALAMTLVGGGALAGGESVDEEQSSTEQQEQQKQQEGVGGSGAEGQSQEQQQDWGDTGVDATDVPQVLDNDPGKEEQEPSQQEGTGGAGEEGQAPEDQQGWDATDIGPVLDNDPNQQEQEESQVQEEPQSEAIGGSGQEGQQRSKTSERPGEKGQPIGETGIDATEADKVFGIESDPQFRVNAGVGVGNYVGDLNQVTGLGPTWQVNAAAQEFKVFGVELGYEGARNPINADNLEDGAAVWKHGVGALAKLGPTLRENIHPFVGAGLGVAYLNANEEAEPSVNNDIMTEIPFAAGVEFQRGNVTAGVRATYRVLLSEEFADVVLPSGETEGNFLSGQITLGGQF